MSDQPTPSKHEREAAEWIARLSKSEISNEELRDFRSWLDDDDNDLAWRRQMAERRPRDRYATRPDSEGYSVVDIWTAEPAVIAMTPQTGMSAFDAEELARMLNRRAAAGDRTIRQ